MTKSKGKQRARRAIKLPAKKKNPKTKEIERSRAASVTSFVATLRRLADALESEVPCRLQVGKLRLSIPARPDLAIEVEREGDTDEVELKLTWKRR